MTEAFSLDDLAALIARSRQRRAPTNPIRAACSIPAPPASPRNSAKRRSKRSIAAVERDARGLKMEAADVLYHLLVLLQDGGVPLQDVIDELAWRTRQSGHQEKASRDQIGGSARPGGGVERNHQTIPRRDHERIRRAQSLALPSFYPRGMGAIARRYAFDPDDRRFETAAIDQRPDFA